MIEDARRSEDQGTAVPDRRPAEAYDPAADPELRRRIEESLDRIRPYLLVDGGSVRLLNISPDFVVELELMGACGTCPLSSTTLRAGIEQAIKGTVPHITRVEAINALTPYYL